MAKLITLKCKGCGIDFDVPFKQRNKKYHNRSCASSNQFNDEDVNKQFRQSLKIGAKKANRTRSINADKIIICLECQYECFTINEFNEHITSHNKTADEYYVTHFLNGIRPQCLCGCKLFTTFRDVRHGFQKLVLSHVTQKMRDDVSTRRKNVPMSQQTKDLISDVLTNFYITEEGKAFTKNRADNLRKFHDSDNGKQWSIEQSNRLLAFNKTEQGKKIRKEVGEALVVFYQDPKNSDAKSKSSKEFWDSPEGLFEADRRSKVMSEFYKTPEGIAAKKEMGKKISLKNLMSKDDFENRLDLIQNDLDILTTLPTYDEYTGFSSFDVETQTKCKAAGHIENRRLINVLNIPKCITCNTLLTKPQNEIAMYVRSLGFDAIDNERNKISPKHLDIYIPAKNLGIEFNGLYWHNEMSRKSDHVKNKIDVCREKNINLLMFFEDEWRDKNDICKSMIKHRLGLFETTVGARKCVIKVLSTNERKTFFNENHLEGDVRAKIAFGLYHGDVIVSAISLRKPFHSSIQNRIELARFASKRGYNVQGALSRLIVMAKKFCNKENIPGIVTYVDCRVGLGKSYLKSGFMLLRETQPRFWWTDNFIRHDRFKFRATDEKTQEEIQKENKLLKIFGAQNLVFDLVV